MGRHGVDQIGAVAAFVWVTLLPLLLVCVVWPGAQAGHTSEYRRQLGSAIDMPLDADVFRPPSGYNAPEQVNRSIGWPRVMLHQSSRLCSRPQSMNSFIVWDTVRVR
jgi:acid phosphatase type 7